MSSSFTSEPSSSTAAVNTATTPVVAFQGERGAFAHMAIAHVWGGGARLLPSRSFKCVVDAVQSGEATHGIIPTTNVTAGDVPGASEQLGRDGIRILQEVTIPVRHALLGIPGSCPDDIREAHSHPMAIKQCLAYLARHPAMAPVEANDTAGAAREVAARRNPWQAAIAGEWCAARYGLVVLARDIQDRPDNTTRFTIVTLATASRPDEQAAAGADSSGSRFVIGKAVGL